MNDAGRNHDLSEGKSFFIVHSRSTKNAPGHARIAHYLSTQKYGGPTGEGKIRAKIGGHFPNSNLLGPHFRRRRLCRMTTFLSYQKFFSPPRLLDRKIVIMETVLSRQVERNEANVQKQRILIGRGAGLSMVAATNRQGAFFLCSFLPTFFLVSTRHSLNLSSKVPWTS